MQQLYVCSVWSNTTVKRAVKISDAFVFLHSMDLFEVLVQEVFSTEQFSTFGTGMFHC